MLVSSRVGVYLTGLSDAKAQMPCTTTNPQRRKHGKDP